jgi:hypothetical protein
MESIKLVAAERRVAAADAGRSTIGLHAGWAAVLALACGVPAAVTAAESDFELAKKMNNPVAALISVPMQYNYDDGLGPRERGKLQTMVVQPVIPIELNADWNLISRTIVPLIDQQDIVRNGLLDESGLGDITQSLFFSPKAPTARGWIWGAGPVFLLPTASEDLLGKDKWGLGPTAVALKQTNGWTVGMLANHIWSVAGDGRGATFNNLPPVFSSVLGIASAEEDISSTFLQPFVSYTTKTFTTVSLNTESTYDWKGEQWSVPINLAVSQMLRVAGQPLSVQVGTRYWAEAPKFGPEGWGFRFALTLLFPK